MATLLLQTAGGLIGGAFGAWGAAAGTAVGALAGNVVDQYLFGPKRHQEGPRLDATPAMAADEGASIQRVYGTVRIATTVIWATRFEETATHERHGGKATGPSATTTTYTYSTSFAVGLCEGPINTIRRIWADGKELDQDGLNIRFYNGSETQAPDRLIEAKQGTGGAPAYRGLAYLVFEDLELERFGNRIPQIEVEVIRCVGRLEQQLRAVSIIPGSTEHGLDPHPVRKTSGSETIECNRHITFAETDWDASINELFAVAPNLRHASLVVSWFGNDLRAEHCTIRPGIVERSSAGETTPWRVAGRTRSSDDVHVVSRHGEHAAYGGTPNDDSVVRAIQDLRARGVAVALNPFLLMDVPSENGLPDPYGNESEQAAYPWRGRITCHPAVGQDGTADQTVAAREQISAFVGHASSSQFTQSDTAVSADQLLDFRYRAFILHYAHLAVAAGGIDTFIVGSELRGLTQVRDDEQRFVFVDALKQLASDVRSVLGPDTNIVYAADWSEYFGHQPNDGSGDVFYHLDPLWADPNIDAVGIDMYAPLSDWRDADADKADNPDGFAHHADLAGFKRQIEAGEGYDWYYASDADREKRKRTPITDGAHGKPWVFRNKDVQSWWENPHYDRRGGVEVAEASPWQPKSKPVWLMEVGCSALQGGAKQPNLFPDPKSSENARPYETSGAVSDAEQRALLQAYIEYWAAEAAIHDDNPVDPDRIYAWAYDARPYPSFPVSKSVWGDGENWQTGHWLNGRLGSAPLSETLAKIAEDHGAHNVTVHDIPHTLDGLVIASPEDARGAIEPFASTYDLAIHDEATSAAPITIKPAATEASRIIPASELVVSDDRPTRTYIRAQHDELPSSVSLSWRDPLYDYKRLVKSTRPLGFDGAHPITLDAPGAMRSAVAEQLSHSWARRLYERSTRVEFSLPLSWVGLQSGDIIAFDDDAERQRWLVQTIEFNDSFAATASALGSQASTAAKTTLPNVAQPHLRGDFGSIPQYALMDLPASDDLEDAKCFMIASRASSAREVAVLVSASDDDFVLRNSIDQKAILGVLDTPLESGPHAVWDTGNNIALALEAGELSSVPDLSALAGSNLAAVEKASGWEVLCFAQATEIEAGKWRLSKLIRGLGGTEDLTAETAPTGARFVLLNEAVRPAGIRQSEMGRAINVRIGEANRPMTDRYFETTSAVPGMRARAPLSPVHVKGVLQAGGDIFITWIRRTRRGGDDWLALDVPLGEEFERYAVTIVSTTTSQTFSLETETNSALVSAAALAAVGIAPGDAVAISVAQISQAVGPGLAATINLPTTDT